MFVAFLTIVASLFAPAQGIPACINADYNDGTQAICYTVNVQTGERVYIDSSDEVVVL